MSVEVMVVEVIRVYGVVGFKYFQEVWLSLLIVFFYIFEVGMIQWSLLRWIVKSLLGLVGYDATLCVWCFGFRLLLRGGNNSIFGSVCGVSEMLVVWCFSLVYVIFLWTEDIDFVVLLFKNGQSRNFGRIIIQFFRFREQLFRSRVQF